MSFNKIMRYVCNNGGVTLAGKGKIVKFDSGYSLHIEDLREALQVAKEHNQLAIWDWKNNCSIYLKEVEI